MKYELFYLVAGSKEAELETIKAGASAIITTEGGVFEEKEVVEKRKLAYQIKHETHGIYVARRFSVEDTEKLQTITRNLNLYTSILRSVISRADELPELKTKEERITAANVRTDKKSAKPAVKVAAPVAEKISPAAKPAVTKEETIESSTATEDIDKKLEEILNI
ncbi:MAG: hypothetical protein COX30_03410 [Candidatus Moranbacteria bacterium CG23_combo_of_CG06-09_8_20_14_all_39_10]|nr:MAG: hypothetical protein COX30_03410 [Candidatus Moranbacteria bacterium CG23_combo_of_CG06-09_8_20_14_all_39_10]